MNIFLRDSMSIQHLHDFLFYFYYYLVSSVCKLAPSLTPRLSGMSTEPLYVVTGYVAAGYAGMEPEALPFALYMPVGLLVFMLCSISPFALRTR